MRWGVVNAVGVNERGHLHAAHAVLGQPVHEQGLTFFQALLKKISLRKRGSPQIEQLPLIGRNSSSNSSSSDIIVS
jgi:hypothetical protein